LEPISYIQAIILGVIQGIFFWEDWKRILSGLWRAISLGGRLDPEDTDARLGWLLVTGTIPAGILGLALEHPTSHAVCLGRGGGDLPCRQRGAAARLRAAARAGAEAHDWEGDSDPRIAKTMSFKQAAAIGTAQAAALIPGISRSGVTMGGGLLTGLSNEDAARFAFPLATPTASWSG
jgi:undecaprenyl-diphosphatase